MFIITFIIFLTEMIICRTAYDNVKQEIVMSTSYSSLLTATIKNMGKTALNRSDLGYTIERTIGEILPKHIADYARATDDMNPAYFSQLPQAPPFFLSRLIWGYIKELILKKDLDLNFFHMVHARQRVSWFKPIHAGDRLTAVMSIQDMEKTRAGELLSLAGTIFDASGDRAAEATVGLMIKGPKKTSSGEGTETPAALEEIARLELPTRKGQNMEYARASLDTSFIHTSGLLARLTGLPGPIMHGICVMAMACAAFSREFMGSDNSRITGMGTRFSRPALPGEKLTMICYKGNPGEVPYAIINERGRTVHKNGFITHTRSDL